ncbi:MAG: hypothetical protein GX053_04895 [Tissierella sp.]|nr:hypothetical protein [Tissierella sp.]
MKEKNRSILFVSLLISLSSLNLIAPTKMFSEKENRYLKQFPNLSVKSIMSGEFTSNFESYVTDQFLGRDNWIGLKTLSQLAILKKDNGRVYFGRDDYLFDISSGIDEEQFNLNMESINKFIGHVREHNEKMPITALLVPTKTEVLMGKLPPYTPIIDEREVVENIKNKLDDYIQIIDLINPLKEHSDDYIYYRTDHHWTTYGAYYGYKEYMEHIGGKGLGKDEFKINQVSNNFYGTSYRKANFYNGDPDSIYSFTHRHPIDYEIISNNQFKSKELYDEKYLNQVDQYSYFLGGDKALIEIETSIQNNKTIVVMKDSFANSLIPFLTAHYNKIVIVDTRYYNGSINDLIQNMDVDEILLLYNVQNFTNEKSFFRFGS